MILVDTNVPLDVLEDGPGVGRFDSIFMRLRLSLVGIGASQFFAVKREKNWTGREFIATNFLR
jgi:hypothetical protein